MTRTTILAAVAALTLAAVAQAQEPRARPRPAPRARTRVETTGPFAFAFSNRGRIGVVVKTDADATNDKIGARIEAVTPGGPAEKAGLKAGDIITRFNGTALGGVAASEDEDDASGPGMKLIELARALDPGDTVQVEYRRGTANSKASVVAEELGYNGNVRIEGPEWNEMPQMGEMKRMMEMPGWRSGPGELSLTIGESSWGGVELVSLNPELGEYFGTSEGVLVVRASEDSTLQLKGGDVILAIGGRKPTSPMHAMRILRSYDVGETVTIDVQRKQRRTTLTWKVPEERGGYFNVMPRTRRPREEPSRFRVMPKIRVAPIRAKLAGLNRVI